MCFVVAPVIAGAALAGTASAGGVIAAGVAAGAVTTAAAATTAVAATSFFTFANVAAIASLGLTAVSTFAQISSQGQERAAEQQRQVAVADAGKFEAQVLKNNQIVLESAAKDAIERGKISETIRRGEVAQLIGIQRAALAGSGIEVGTGSALEVTSDTIGIGEFESSVIRANAEREAFELRVEASNLGSQANLTLLKTRQVGLGPDPRLTTALSGAGSILGNFAVFRANKII